MKISKLYFPVAINQALDVLRGTRQLNEVCPADDIKHTIVGYTDRAVAVLEQQRLAAESGTTGGEVPLIVCSMDEQLFNELLMGDFTHFGPCAHWRSPHVLELEPAGYGRFTHEADISMEIISRT